jgi:hypothetical protein
MPRSPPPLDTDAMKPRTLLGVGNDRLLPLSIPPHRQGTRPRRVRAGPTRWLWSNVHLQACRPRCTIGGVAMNDEFRTLYAAYQYLASEGRAGVASSTRGLLEAVWRGDAAVMMRCFAKLLEEQAEVDGVTEGRHSHAGQTGRETMLNECQQSLYWAFVLAVGRGLAFDDAVLLHRTMEYVDRCVERFNSAYPGEAIEAREVALADLRQMATRPYLAKLVADG